MADGFGKRQHTGRQLRTLRESHYGLGSQPEQKLRASRNPSGKRQHPVRSLEGMSYDMMHWTISHT